MVEKVVVPALRVPVPRVVVPSLKVTVPVGVPTPRCDSEVTWAVKVTDWPKTEGLTEEVTVVLLLAWFTVWVRTLRCCP